MKTEPCQLDPKLKPNHTAEMEPKKYIALTNISFLDRLI